MHRESSSLSCFVSVFASHKADARNISRFCLKRSGLKASPCMWSWWKWLNTNKSGLSSSNFTFWKPLPASMISWTSFVQTSRQEVCPPYFENFGPETGTDPLTPWKVICIKFGTTSPGLLFLISWLELVHKLADIFYAGTNKRRPIAPYGQLKSKSNLNSLNVTSVIIVIPVRILQSYLS